LISLALYSLSISVSEIVTMYLLVLVCVFAWLKFLKIWVVAKRPWKNLLAHAFIGHI